MNPPKEPQPSQGAGAEELARAFFERELPHLKDDKYYKENPDKSLTLRCYKEAYAAGRASQDARIGDCKHAFRIGDEELDYCRICHAARDGRDFRNFVQSRKQLSECKARLASLEEQLAYEKEENTRIWNGWDKTGNELIAAKGHLAEAQKELAFMREDRDKAAPRFEKLMRDTYAERDSLRSSLALAKEALEFYATRGGPGGMGAWVLRIAYHYDMAVKDGEEMLIGDTRYWVAGKRARAALAVMGARQEGEK